MSEICVILTTVDTLDKGKELARYLVESKLAACVSMVPGVESIYFWEGEVQDEKEWLLIIKTIRKKIPAIREAFNQYHLYRVPELIVIRSDYTGPAYADWLFQYVNSGD